MTKLEEITQALLDRLPEACRFNINNKRDEYEQFKHDRNLSYENLLKMNEYLWALRDARFISEYEVCVLRQYILNKTPKEED